MLPTISIVRLYNDDVCYILRTFSYCIKSKTQHWYKVMVANFPKAVSVTTSEWKPKSSLQSSLWAYIVEYTVCTVLQDEKPEGTSWFIWDQIEMWILRTTSSSPVQIIWADTILNMVQRCRSIFPHEHLKNWGPRSGDRTMLLPFVSSNSPNYLIRADKYSTFIFLPV